MGDILRQWLLCSCSCSTPERRHFIDQFPDEIIGASTLGAVTGIDSSRMKMKPCRVGPKGIHVYSRDAVFEMARKQFASCSEWLSIVEKLHRRSIIHHRIPEEMLWKQSYFHCSACDIVVNNPSKHIERTHGCCKDRIECRWMPVSSEVPSHVHDHWWCVWCNIALEQRDADSHIATCHFGIGNSIKLLVPGVRCAHPGLREIRGKLESTPECSKWADLWEDAYVVCSHEVNKIVPILKSGDWNGRSVCAIVRTTGVVRHCIRQHMKGSGIKFTTRGEHEKVLLACRESDVVELLLQHLPEDVVNCKILPEYRDLVSKDDSAYRKKYSTTNRRHIWTCDRCGVGSDDVDILHSDYMPGSYCDTCIDDDDELSRRNQHWLSYRANRNSTDRSIVF